MLRGGLGVQLPMIPMESERDTIGFCDCWSGLNEDAWEYFSRPENFGKDFQGIAELKSTAPHRERLVRDRSIGGNGDGPTRQRAAAFAKGDAKRVEERCKAGDKAFAPYLDKFSFFFSADFLVKRMFEQINSENKPEHAGFCKACHVLYQLYKQQAACSENSLLEHVYDDMIVTLDIDRISAFFAWLGVIKFDYESFWQDQLRTASADCESACSNSSTVESNTRGEGMTIPERVAALEAMQYGASKSGGMAPRIANLEQTVHGEAKSGPITTRLTDLEHFLAHHLQT
jgi:hypothetical protein